MPEHTKNNDLLKYIQLQLGASSNFLQKGPENYYLPKSIGADLYQI